MRPDTVPDAVPGSQYLGHSSDEDAIAPMSGRLDHRPLIFGLS
ncbi:hypothetical protein ABZV67_08900 [Streptomyces sp. NPDC005065]